MQGFRSHLGAFQLIFGQTEVVVGGMIHAGAALRAIVNPNGLGVSHMNETLLCGAAFLRMIPGSVRTGRAVHAFDRATSN